MSASLLMAASAPGAPLPRAFSLGDWRGVVHSRALIYPGQQLIGQHGSGSINSLCSLTQNLSSERFIQVKFLYIIPRGWGV